MRWEARVAETNSELQKECGGVEKKVDGHPCDLQQRLFIKLKLHLNILILRTKDVDALIKSKTSGVYPFSIEN